MLNGRELDKAAERERARHKGLLNRRNRLTTLLGRASGWESSSSALDGAAEWERAGQVRWAGESRLELLEGKSWTGFLDGRGGVDRAAELDRAARWERAG